MRKVIYGGACSLDGFLTGPDGAMDWLHFSQDAQAIMGQTWATMDAMLFGRKTWEVAAGGSQGEGGADGGRRRKGGKRGEAGKAASAGSRRGSSGPASYLFSRTITAAPDGMTLVRDDAGGFVRQLKQAPGRDIIVMSGGNLARSLFDAGVIDEVGLNIHPVLLGAGTPTFLDPGRRIRLELLEARALDGGCVFVRYGVKRDA